MTFVRLAFFPTATAEHYAVLQRQLAGAPVPPTRLFFAAGPVGGGWQVVQVWSTRAALEEFNQQVLFPAYAVLGGSPFPLPPSVTDLEPVEVHTALAGAAAQKPGGSV